MKKIMLLTLILILMSCSVQSQGIEVDPLKKSSYESESIKKYEDIDEKIVSALQDFSIKTSAQLLDEDNHVYSPLSFYMALSMVLPLAQNETKEQLTNFLNPQDIPFDILQFNNEYGNLSLANSMWLQSDLDFNSDLMNQISDDYFASIYSVDFRNSNTPKQMNQWINKMTNNFIKDVEVDITDDMVMSLINTIYLKDSWSEPFEIRNTTQEPFDKDKTAHYMNLESTMGYLKQDNYQLVSKELMNGSKVSFILPDEDLDSILDEQTLSSIIKSKYESRLIRLSVPKFDVDGDYSLIELSQQLGLTLPFDPSNSEIYPFEDKTHVFISVIKQQARLVINEDGIEAAAFTQVGMDTASMPINPITIKFDKPFLVVITSPQGIPLFISTVVNPESH